MGNNVHKKSNEKATSNIRFISLFSIFPKGSLRMLRMGTLPIIQSTYGGAGSCAHWAHCRNVSGCFRNN